MNEVKEYLEQVVKLYGSISRNKKLRYFCFEDFVLKNGKEYKIATGNGKIKRGKMKECFMNAFHLADGGENYTYVEGYARTKGLPIPVLHAWCLNTDGKVVDPTWKDGEEYIGIAFDFKYICQVALQRKKFGVIDNYEMGFPLLTGEHENFKKEGK